MKGARYFLAWVLFAPLSLAQAPARASREATGLGITADNDEVRLEIHTSAPGASARVIAVYADQLVLDVTGPALEKNSRRILVGHNGVRAVRVWRQSENPPVTRIVVELSAPSTYLLSTTGDRAVLRVGPAVEGGLLAASPQPRRAGQSSGSVAAAQAIIGIFRRGSQRSSPTQAGPAPPSPLPQDRSASAATQPPRPGETEAASTASANRPEDFTPPPPVTETPKPTEAVASANPAPQPEKPAPRPITEAPKPVEPVASVTPAAKHPEQPPTPSVAETSKPAETAASANSAAKPSEKPAPPPPAVKTPEPVQPALPVNAEPAAVAAKSEPPPKDSANASPSPSPGSGAAVAAPAAPSASPVNPQEVISAPAADSSATPVAEREGPRPISEDEMRLLEAAANSGIRNVFHVKHVEQDSVYLDGGRSSGLEEGMKLVVKEKMVGGKAKEQASSDGLVAELVVVGVAETSAVTEIHTPKRAVVPGDLAYLSAQDAQTLVQQRALGETRKYPVVVSFSEGADPLDEEARAAVPRPPLPSVNRARGRIGLDYLSTIGRDSSGARSSDLGLVFRADITRIGGTYWNLGGYWRGRLDSRSSASQPTLQDLINRTYHLSLTYDNPNSRWVAGFGRLYLPWASSLDTIDGGYFGRRIFKAVTAGIFAGSTPDPTSWDYNPDRRLGGAFLNFEGGSFDSFRYTSTSGMGVSLLKWQVDRPFIFFENAVSYKRHVSVYHSLQADSPRGNPAVPAPGPGVSRSFFTVRLDPHPRLEFTLNHTYFRDIPTFDPQLVGTGLLDKYLFQGASAGARVEVVKQIFLYADLGRSNRTGDAKSSLNQMYGITFGRVPWVGLRADAHYSRFNSSFGEGTYRAFSLARNFGEIFHLDVLVGDQAIVSTLAGNQSARFVTTLLDTSLGSRLFLTGGFTTYRGQLQNYDQWNVTLGYRFDSRRPHW